LKGIGCTSLCGAAATSDKSEPSLQTTRDICKALAQDQELLRAEHLTMISKKDILDL
jgi:hypothetical protein